MPRIRTPLPPIIGTHAVATDWKTGLVVQDVVFRDGKWWDASKWARDSDGSGYERDRERIRKRRTVSRFLSSQSADPGL